MALDQRGHGHSDHAETYTREAYLGDLEAFGNHLHLAQPVIMLGNSLGGVNAYQFAARRPERVRALIIEDIGAVLADDVSIVLSWEGTFKTRDALAEMRRVTRPGGRLVVCEFSTITIAPVDKLYRRYLLNILPAIARRTARSPDAYEYLAESITDWPAQRELAGLIEAAGWSAVRWRDLSLGAVAVHVARRS